MKYDVQFRRRNLCVVLLDLIGSTAFVQRHGAQRAARHFQFHDRLARSLLYRYNGREIDRSDGFLCSFERVGDAVDFALEYQRTIPRRTGLGCRIGMHWGDIVEVQQDDLFVAANAKSIELEGITKNIAARVMSICGRGQVLMTEAAMSKAKSRLHGGFGPDVMSACVGVYRFKGVRDPITVYAVGRSLDVMQPPKGNDKVKRLGGPKYIKKRARDRKLVEWLLWAYYRLVLITALWLTWGLVHILYYFDMWGVYDAAQVISAWLATLWIGVQK